MMIKYTDQFKEDFKQQKQGKYKQDIEQTLFKVIQDLANHRELTPSYKDNAITDNWVDCRRCNIKTDLILIYREFEETLQLIRLVSYNQL